MRAEGWRRIPLLVRVAVYVAIIIVIFALRGGVDGLSSLFPYLAPDRPVRLTIAGADLAPDLVPGLVEAYRSDYPDTETVLRGGGTTHALEDLFYDRANVAFAWRPPTDREQGLFLAAHDDSALAFRVALGAILVLRAARAAPLTLDVGDLAGVAHGAGPFGLTRLYVSDPNTGLWDVASAALELDPDATFPGVVFLADEAAVLSAAATDTTAVALVSDLAVRDPSEMGFEAVALARVAGDAPHLPTIEAVATDAYPLTHYLYACCRADGPVTPSKFITHLTGRRGQRQVERAGHLPARHIARPVVVSREPIS